jgi:hypothetical protein
MKRKYSFFRKKGKMKQKMSIKSESKNKGRRKNKYPITMAIRLESLLIFSFR